MLRSIALLISLCFASLGSFAFADDASDLVNDQLDVAITDWPWWRGPNRNGIAHAAQNPPLEWDATKNVIWKAKIPGRGHGSPIVCADRVLLVTADPTDESQSLMCFHRESGKVVWKKDVHERGFPAKLNKKASNASSTPAWDGQNYYVTFVSHDAAYATSFDAAGNERWQTRVTDYTVHQGYGASPLLYQSLVIVAADNKKAGAIAALDRETGNIVWKHDRPNKPNYPSPIVLRIDDRDQLLLTGTDLVTSLSPLDGKVNWEIEGSTTECVTSTVTDGELIFTSGGYPDNHMSAVRADGSGEIVWQNRNRVYVPSMVAYDGYLYGVLDAGVAACWESSTGKEMWKARLGGTFSASPVLVNGHIYATNEEGETFVYACRSDKYEQLAKNKLGDNVMATQTICGGHIYARVAFDQDRNRQEMLYCIGGH